MVVTVGAALAAGRRLALDLMRDTCTVTRVTGTAGVNEATGRAVILDSTIYTGACQVRVPQAQPGTPEAGERVATVQQFIVKLPLASPEVKVGDLVQVTASPTDPELVGRTWRVAGLHHKTYSTARKLVCEETTG